MSLGALVFSIHRPPRPWCWSSSSSSFLQPYPHHPTSTGLSSLIAALQSHVVMPPEPPGLPPPGPLLSPRDTRAGLSPVAPLEGRPGARCCCLVKSDGEQQVVRKSLQPAIIAAGYRRSHSMWHTLSWWKTNTQGWDARESAAWEPAHFHSRPQLTFNSESLWVDWFKEVTLFTSNYPYHSQISVSCFLYLGVDMMNNSGNPPEVQKTARLVICLSPDFSFWLKLRLC